MKIGFDNEKYLQMQSSHIRERINQFDNKLYLEFGGKLFDDYHASRVLPGFAPDSKLQMLMQLSDQAEIVVVISAGDIEKNKVRGDLGITYDADVLRLIDAFRSIGLYVGSVVITQYAGQQAAEAFQRKLEALGVINSPDYWADAAEAGKVQYLGILLKKAAQTITKAGTRTNTPEEGVAALQDTH